MEEILRRREELRRRVMSQAREWAGRLDYPATVVVIGSYARGDFGEWSDVDVLVISPHFRSVRPHQRILMLEPPPSFEPIPLTPEEWAMGVALGKPHAMEALEKGVILRDDLGLFKYRKTSTRDHRG